MKPKEKYFEKEKQVPKYATKKEQMKHKAKIIKKKKVNQTFAGMEEKVNSCIFYCFKPGVSGVQNQVY